jgi:hypothetical protein
MREVREAKAHPPSSYPRSVSESPSTRTVGKTLFACVAVVAMAARSPSQSPSPPSPHCSLVLSLPPHSHANTPRGAAGPFGAAVQPKATAMATAEAATVATCAVVGGHIPMVSMCSTVSKFQKSLTAALRLLWARQSKWACSERGQAAVPFFCLQKSSKLSQAAFSCKCPARPCMSSPPDLCHAGPQRAHNLKSSCNTVDSHAVHCAWMHIRIWTVGWPWC